MWSTLLVSAPLEAVGARDAAPTGLLGAPSGPHALCPEESQDAAGTGGCQRRVCQHALTQCLPPQVLAEWQAWATHRVHAFQRASSAVEGRNGCSGATASQSARLAQARYKVWTVLHNFDCRAADGTTPASRFFRRTFPDLFETVLSHIEALPRPRRRKNTKCAKSLKS